MNEKRINWIDVAKGWAIFLVIIGHSGISQYLCDVYSWIYSFHMALFFILSGYVFSVKKYHRYGGFLLHKLKTLIIPYFVFQVLNNFIWHLYVRLGFVAASNRSIGDEVIGLFFQVRGGAICKRIMVFDMPVFD